MPYCTFSELQAIYSYALLERLCTRAGDADIPAPPDVETRAMLAVGSSAGVMDTFFLNVYPVPVSTAQVGTLALLRNCNAALAISELVIQRGYVSGSEDEQLVTAARRQWLDWLASIRNGKTQLPGVSVDAVSGDQASPQSSFFVTSEEPWYPSSSRFC